MTLSPDNIEEFIVADYYEGDAIRVKAVRIEDVAAAVTWLQKKLKDALLECESDMMPLDTRKGIKGKVISVDDWEDFKEVLNGLSSEAFGVMQEATEKKGGVK